MTEIIIFYKYTTVKDPAGFVAWHKELCTRLSLKGRIIIAKEGINATLEGKKKDIAAYEEALTSHYVAGRFGDFTDVWFKSSKGTGNAFPRLQVRVRDEIVTLGLPKSKDVDPNETTGTHLEASELREWFKRGEKFEIIDMRNDYEYAVGHFKDSIDPKLGNFRDLDKKMKELKKLKDKKVLTVCTYGVRCEKASSFLKKNGFKDVYQLKGGIGTYMKKYPGKDFLGQLYVFDKRMTEVFTDKYEKVGKCKLCKATTEHCHDCSFPECHKQMLVCDGCLKDGVAFCSKECQKRYEKKCTVKA